MESSEEKFESETAHSLEKQANCEELASLLLFERLQNPKIRQQVVDLIFEAEQSRKDEKIVETVRDEEGKPLKEGSKFITIKKVYIPETKERIEEDFDKALVKVMTDTPISLGEEQPSLRLGGREVLPLKWIFPTTGQKPNRQQMSIIEAHEKGHMVRRYLHGYLDDKFLKAFDPSLVEITESELSDYKNMTREEAKKSLLRYLFSASELAERMSQLKNYFGMRGDEQFTKEHLYYAKEHYIQDTGMDNRMKLFFQAISLEKEPLFIELINSTGI